MLTSSRSCSRITLFFCSFAQADLEQLGWLMQLQVFRPKEVLFEEGDAGDRFYIVMKGCVQMLQRRAGGSGDLLLATYSARDRVQQAACPWFGEMAMHCKQSRNATALCIEPTKLLIVLESALASFMKLVPRFEEMLETKLQAVASLNEIAQSASASARESFFTLSIRSRGEKDFRHVRTT
mmetsp:Transcript_30086/g.49815  ORF Transcript_30086/g.49815 Transcript_30086/m.49815 type:complete len:181 (-) Transcript_30086:173-715(-)